jgi:NAD(P)-dependent dehydrogenase (short-subunit alcohol dehydrogenase family)
MLKDRVAIVTGATSGIGRATARLFAQNGAVVAAVGRNELELNALKNEPHDGEGSIQPQLADVTDLSQIDRLVNVTIDNFGKLDILVNAAGIIKNGNVWDTSIDDWDRMLTINLRSVFYLMQRSVPFLERTKGNIVNVSSVTGPRAFPNVLAYCVSKAGVDQLTRCSALELAPKGIRVNAVNPGVVITGLHRRSGMTDDKYEAFLEHSKSTHPLGRVGRPEEIAELIMFLSSDKAGWITAATYEIDGGRGQTCAR